MPHICTRCNNVFDSGEDILKGCPVCGWKKFMFVRRSPKIIDKKEDDQTEQIITQAMGVRIPPKRLVKDAVEKPVPSQLPPVREAKVSGAESDKLESIKITAPGTYELNLPSLFEREELIMAVKEGTYFIDLSSAFRKGKKE